MGSPSPTRAKSGKFRDPVFFCMVGAMILALASSILLRTVVSGIGPTRARAADASVDPAADASDDANAPLPPLPKNAPPSHSR